MSRILVIGGYGGFGARLSRRLAQAGHGVIVAGRDAIKAELFCAGLPGSEPAAVDRNGDLGGVLARLRPDLVIDSAGPFQGSSYAVAEACIAAGVPYLDLADAREFVLGIGKLDQAARAAGVAVIAGASTVPALTGAVARRLAEGLERVDEVEIALSAPNGGAGGAAVVRAILSYVGRPVRLWRGGRWEEATGWQELRREDFLLSDGGVRGRLVAVADVPDCELLPALLPGRPAVTFRAGTELSFHMLALWLASWPVRWGWLGSLAPAAPVMQRLYRLTLGLGGRRSAMKLVLRGRAHGIAVERVWTLVAEQGNGPEVPTLAAALLAEDFLAGRVSPGARDASSLLTLDRFEQLFDALALRHETTERRLPPPLYERLAGAAYAALPKSVADMHRVNGDCGASGEATVERGRGPVARLLAAIMRMPPAGSYELHVRFAERGGAERWHRDFGGHRFASELRAHRGLLAERFGPIRFLFDLPCGPDGLEMRFRGWSLFGVPLPRAFAPRIAASETEREGRFAFEVEVALPWGTRIVRYSGMLARDEAAPAQEKGRPREAAPILRSSPVA